MSKAHCPRCAGYEDRVMRRAEGSELPEAVKPCKDFQMSDRFRDWAVSQMSHEVGGQLSAAGLNRMALLKSPKRLDKQEKQQETSPDAE